MRKIVFGLMLLLVAISLWAQTSPSDYLPLFDRTPNAAIRGFNDLHLVNVTPEEAAKACIEGQYLSFDYYKETEEADLSYTTAQSAGGLDTDFSGNPYDHYSYLGGLEPVFFQENIDHIQVVMKTEEREEMAEVSVLSIAPSSRITLTGERYINMEEYGEEIVAAAYYIRLSLKYSDGVLKELVLFYCPRCDLYYTAMSIEGGVYSDYAHSRIPFYGGRETPELGRKTLVIVEEGLDSRISYEFAKLDDSGNILPEPERGLNATNGEDRYQDWKTMDIQNYSFTLQMNQSHWLMATIKLVVRNSIVIDYEILEQYGYGTGRENIILTIDDLFTEYIISEQYNSLYTTITYDETWRFPSLYRYDIELMTDEEVYWSISDFTITS